MQEKSESTRISSTKIGWICVFLLDLQMIEGAPCSIRWFWRWDVIVQSRFRGIAFWSAIFTDTYSMHIAYWKAMHNRKLYRM